MTIASKLIGLSMNGGLATRVTGTVITTEAAAGTTQAGATLLTLDDVHIVSTSASNAGVIIPPGNGTADTLSAGDSMQIANYSGNTMKVYPPVGGKINNGSANASISLTTLQKGIFTCIDGTSYTAVVS